MSSRLRPGTPRVCMVMLTRNSVSKLPRPFILKALKSLLSQDYENLKLIIADNCSSDDTVAFVQAFLESNSPNFEWKLVRLKENYGWSGGNNRAALLCKGSDFVFYLNDDIILEKDCMARLVEVMCKNPGLGAVQPLIVNRDGSVVCGFTMGIGGFMEVIDRATRNMFEPFYVSGAALFTRTELFFKVGMFDEELFLMHDDADYCYRLRLTGHNVACINRAKAYHWGGATLGSGNAVSWYYVVRNNLWVLTKNSELKYLAPRCVLAILESLVSWFWYAVFRLKDVKRARMVMKGILSGLQGMPRFVYKRKMLKKIKVKEERVLFGSMDIIMDIGRVMPPLARLLRSNGKKWADRNLREGLP